MHPQAAEAILNVVRSRVREGDHPSVGAQSVETLEDCLLEVAQQRDRLRSSAPVSPTTPPEPDEELDSWLSRRLGDVAAGTTEEKRQAKNDITRRMRQCINELRASPTTPEPPTQPIAWAVVAQSNGIVLETFKRKDAAEGWLSTTYEARPSTPIPLSVVPLFARSAPTGDATLDKPPGPHDL